MSANPFGLLGEDDSDDLTQLVIAAQQLKAADPAQAKKAPAPAAAAPQAKLPSKPLPPAQAVREGRNDGGRGGGRGRGRGGRVGGFNRDASYGDNNFSGNVGRFRSSEDKDGEKFTETRGGYGGPRGSFRGGRSGGFTNGGTDEVDRPRRVYERHSGTGRGEIKREGGGRRNWGTAADEIAPALEEVVAEKEKPVESENPEVEQEGDATKEKPVVEPEEKEPEYKEMTLEEYEKVLEEKRKAHLALKPEERKVDADSEFKSMQQLSSKKSNDEIFIKLGSDKEKRKETTEKEEKVKKAIDNRTVWFSNPSYARACVEIDISKELPNEVWISTGAASGFWQEIVYENRLQYCSKCKLHGHLISSCRKVKQRLEEEKRIWAARDEHGLPTVTSLITASKEVDGVDRSISLTKGQQSKTSGQEDMGKTLAQKRNGKQSTLLKRKKVPALQIENRNCNSLATGKDDEAWINKRITCPLQKARSTGDLSKAQISSSLIKETGVLSSPKMLQEKMLPSAKILPPAREEIASFCEDTMTNPFPSIKATSSASLLPSSSSEVLEKTDKTGKSTTTPADEEEAIPNGLQNLEVHLLSDPPKDDYIVDHSTKGNDMPKNPAQQNVEKVDSTVVYKGNKAVGSASGEENEQNKGSSAGVTPNVYTRKKVPSAMPNVVAFNGGTPQLSKALCTILEKVASQKEQGRAPTTTVILQDDTIA